MASSSKYVEQRLQGFCETKRKIRYEVIVSSDNRGTYYDQFVLKYTPELAGKKYLQSETTIYFAFREKAESSHWTAAVLQLKRKNPKLFIFDSIRNISQTTVDTFSQLMGKYGGSTYTCCSGLQYDDDSCKLFTLDFLFEMAKMSKGHAIFTYLVRAKQNIPSRTVNGVTRIETTDLPWRLVRNAQRLQDLDSWFEVNGDNTDLREYLEAHTVIKTIQTSRGEKSTKVNDGIIHTFS